MYENPANWESVILFSSATKYLVLLNAVTSETESMIFFSPRTIFPLYGIDRPGVTRHKKNYCENNDGHLGWTCPVSTFVGFETSLDLDHLDGDHHNNVPSNVKTYCKLCHGRKSILNGDCNSNKSSSRR